MPSEARARRVGDRIREDLSEILQREVHDPALELVTVTGVEVDREFGYATVYVTTSDPERKADVLAGFARARGFLRSALAARIPLRSFPQLRFRYDSSVDEGARIEDLLKQIHRGGSRGS
ncbi:MAG TPA: 30S ribosome-binding factor RbfA [Anaerolineales bacterium]|nr:30S ribosome-binding factor RbfA [Anaerolineales bacterium]